MCSIDFTNSCQLFLYLEQKLYMRRIMTCHCGARPQKSSSNCPPAKREITSSRLDHLATTAYATADTNPQVVTLGTTGKHMCQGEFESLKAIYAVSPGFVPEPYAWGKYTQEDPETYFLLAEFRDVGKQVRALSSAVVRYTLAYNNLASFLFLPPFGPQWLSRSVPFAYHTN